MSQPTWYIVVFCCVEIFSKHTCYRLAFEHFLDYGLTDIIWFVEQESVLNICRPQWLLLSQLPLKMFVFVLCVISRVSLSSICESLSWSEVGVIADLRC